VVVNVVKVALIPERLGGGHLVYPLSEDGGGGTDEESGSVVIYSIPAGEQLNWDIATYVHTSTWYYLRG
jgi:hypothetical protein